MGYTVFPFEELEWKPRREGDPRLVKVTTAGDLEHVESLLGGDGA